LGNKQLLYALCKVESRPTLLTQFPVKIPSVSSPYPCDTCEEPATAPVLSTYDDSINFINSVISNKAVLSRKYIPISKEKVHKLAQNVTKRSPEVCRYLEIPQATLSDLIKVSLFELVILCGRSTSMKFKKIVLLRVALR
jgi:hypothetical protein